MQVRFHIRHAGLQQEHNIIIHENELAYGEIAL
jgi:hypothetical protein